jgi:hypothetical protein
MSLSGPCVHRDLLNWMLVSACQQGHLEVVRMLVQGYHADAEDCAIHQEEFAVITGLPLYAAARAGRQQDTHCTYTSHTVHTYTNVQKFRNVLVFAR